jgi:hypothetical protein
VKKGFMIWVAAESADEIYPRARAWQIQQGIAEGDEPDIWFIDQQVPFNNQPEVDRFIESIQRQCEQLGKEVAGIAFDTYARCTPRSNENDTEQAKFNSDSILLIGERLKTQTLTIHHTSATGRIRGNTALPDAMDMIWTFTRDETGIKLHCEKMRGHPEPADFYVALRSQMLSETDPDDTAPVVIAASSEEEQSTPSTPKTQLQMLRVLQAHGRLNCSQWQRQCEEAHHIVSATFYLHRTTLEQDGLIAPENEKQRGKAVWYVITEKGEQLLG